MITTIIFDFSRVLLKVKDAAYAGGLNDLHRNLKNSAGYNILDHFELNEELLKYLEKIKDKYDLYIFTTGMVQNEPELRQKLDPIFKDIFSVGETGFRKDTPEGYKSLLEKIGVKAEETLFVDDTQLNIDSAKKAGLQTIHYRSNLQLFSDLNARLP